MIELTIADNKYKNYGNVSTVRKQFLKLLLWFNIQYWNK